MPGILFFEKKLNYGQCVKWLINCKTQNVDPIGFPYFMFVYLRVLQRNIETVIITVGNIRHDS